MNCRDLLKKVNEYNQLNRELEQARLNYSNLKTRTESEVATRFDTLSSNIQRFCGGESFRSVIKNFCYLYSDILSVVDGNLTYRGKVPMPINVNSDNAQIIAGQCVNDIKSSFQVLAQKRGNPDIEIRKLCVSFATLRAINARVEELKVEATRRALMGAEENIEIAKRNIAALLSEFPELADTEKTAAKLTSARQSIQEEIDRFNLDYVAVPDSYSTEVSIPFARNSAVGDYESGVMYWNPLKQGILHVKVPCGRYEIASDFIIGLTMQFLHSYPKMSKQILYCCQNSLSKMDAFLRALKDTCKDSVFFNGIEQLEADMFYQEISDRFKELRGEVKRRSELMDTIWAEDIYEYNVEDKVEIISPILVILHDYPTGFSGCKDLGYFFRECARYGIFFVVLETSFDDGRSSVGICDPSQYRSLKCELNEDGTLTVRGAVCDAAYVDKMRVRSLLSRLVANADKGNKNTYLTYEEVGFGTTDSNADGYSTKISIPIGKLNNKVFSLDFATSTSDEDKKKGIKTPLAYLVVGGPGSGKSTLIDSLIINGSMAYSPDDLTFYLLDFKDGVTASFYDGLNAIPHVRMIASRSKEEDSDIILTALISEKERRNELIKASGSADIAGYNAKNEKKMPRIIVIVDECQNLFASDILAAKCEKLAREGRSSGIHLVLASQDAKLNMMQHAGKFIDGRFCFFTPEISDAAQVINHEYTKTLNIDVPKGSGLAYMSLENGSNCKKIQIAFHGGDKSGNKAVYNGKIREKWSSYPVQLIKAGENGPLMLNSYSEMHNPLMLDSSMRANIGENYVDHSMFNIDFSKDTSHSVLMLGDDEKPYSDILTSVISSALSMGGKVTLIDESFDQSLSKFFGSHPRVTSVGKRGYLSTLAEVYAEYERRNEDFRAKYEPYFFVINSLYRIDDYCTDKKLELEDDTALDIDSFDGDLLAMYEKQQSKSKQKTDISGKTTLLAMLSQMASVSNMYIIIATKSELNNDYDERHVFASCGYKVLQSGVSAVSYHIMDNLFREKMLEGLGNNIVFVSNRGVFSKCRYFRYDWNDDKTKRMLSDAMRKQRTIE